MPSMMKTTAASILACAAGVSAHGFVQGIVAAGKYYTGYLVDVYPYETNPPASIGWADSATDLGFVAPNAYGSGDIICHRSAKNAQATATVEAGSTIKLEWTTWPSSHHGPVIDYLASCKGDCSTVDKTTLEFFKIHQAGLIDDTTSPGTWASDQLIANNNSWSVTIPSAIASGSYVLRHEIIALHSAGNSNGAQNYPQCINIEVTGGGSDVPVGTLGEALYSETDSGILLSIYTTGLNYKIPGPALYTGGLGTGSASATGLPATTSSSIATSHTTTGMVNLAHNRTTAAPTTLATSTSVAGYSGGNTCES